jgi:hypothetical protein
MVMNAQHSINTLSYTVNLSDSYGSRRVYTLTEKTIVKVNKADSLFGFQFWCKSNDLYTETIYDGNLIYNINNDTRTYYSHAMDPSYLSQLYSGDGIEVIIPDLVKLDTLGASDFKISQNKNYYYLTITYKKQDGPVIPRTINYKNHGGDNIIPYYKKLTINKKTMLPVAIIIHKDGSFHTSGFYYFSFTIKDIHINDPDTKFDFSPSRFLKDYKGMPGAVVNLHFGY